MRFTRRQLREHLAATGAGWGDTQLKVHLARLVDLELLVVHRLTSGAFGYELTWTPPTTGEVGGRFLAGLTDPTTLTSEPSTHAPSAYDTGPAGTPGPVVGVWSGPGRPLVGSRSHPTGDAHDVSEGPWAGVSRVAAGGR
ncbi:hypothetical protein [Cellulomonas uda]|uniref:Uncharacterized protein n=1 Tax=Cellulomonas uda TaxID=1714 RepID=A0A4Y3KBQ7_CELUD|nr:hypothetical protein [Cellulomonas uda]NII65694.1 hypothetical protein [Cellulomonas uda]GEA81427.1 hypothetical protein CUD01_18710 [Cellulomonas uda]